MSLPLVPWTDLLPQTWSTEYDNRVELFILSLLPSQETSTISPENDDISCKARVDFRQKTLDAERQMVNRLRDTGVNGVEVLRIVQEELDLEASNFSN